MIHDEKSAKVMAGLIFPTEELQKCIDFEVDYLIDYFKKEKQKDLMPMVHIFYRKNFNEPLNQTLVAFADLPYDEDRKKAFMGLGAKFYQDNNQMVGSDKGHVFHPLCIVMSTEMWVRKNITKEQKEEHDKAEKPVRDYDDKTEAVGVFAMTLDNRTGLQMFDIQRDLEGNILPFEKPTKPAEFDVVKTYLLENFYNGYVMAMSQDKEYMDYMEERAEDINE